MKFRGHKYTWQKPYTSTRHQWELIGPTGGIHFHVSIQEDQSYGPSCGLEFHSILPTSRDEAPHHTTCWLTGGRCWHDGTSLYASESVWPFVEPILRDGDHPAIFRYLEREYVKHFERDDE